MDKRPRPDEQALSARTSRRRGARKSRTMNAEMTRSEQKNDFQHCSHSSSESCFYLRSSCGSYSSRHLSEEGYGPHPQRYRTDPPSPPVRPRLEAEDRLPRPVRDRDRPEGVVRPVDRDFRPVDPAGPAREPHVREHQEPAALAAEVDRHPVPPVVGG